MTETHIHPAEAAVIGGFAQQANAVREVRPGELYAVLGPDGDTVIVTTDGWAFEPRRNTSTPTLRDAEGLIGYVDVYTDSVEAIEAYADLEQRQFVVIIDGHDGWRGHRATLQLITSPEWNDWMTISGKFMGQVEFAEFVEDHISSIADPDGASLLEIVNTLVGTSSVAWTGGENTRTGSRKLNYAETVEAKAGHKGDIEVPASLTLGLRPFMGSDRFSVKATIRFRMDHGKLQLAAKLLEPEAVAETAFNDVRAVLDDGLPCQIMTGRP